MSEVAPRNVTTPRLGLNQPDIGGDVDAWGGLLNANATVLDKALLTTGGTMTGALSLAADPAVALGAATKQYVDETLAAATAGVSSFNTRTGAVTLTAADVTGAGGAPLASPVFTGNPQAPTPAAGDNDTSVPTTAFVQTAVAPALHNVG